MLAWSPDGSAVGRDVGRCSIAGGSTSLGAGLRVHSLASHLICFLSLVLVVEDMISQALDPTAVSAAACWMLAEQRSVATVLMDKAMLWVPFPFWVLILSATYILFEHSHFFVNEPICNYGNSHVILVDCLGEYAFRHSIRCLSGNANLPLTSVDSSHLLQGEKKISTKLQSALIPQVYLLILV